MIFPLKISVTFFNNLSTNVREFVVSEEVQILPRLKIETNHKGNHMFLLDRNASLETKNKTRTIKTVVQPASVIRHPRTFMAMLEGNPSIQMAGLVSSFQYEENNSMMSELLKEYVLASAEEAYEGPAEHAPMGFMTSGDNIMNP